MRPIDADETRKKMLNSLDELFKNIEMTGKMIYQKTLIRTIIHHIDNAQTIEAAPVKHARWIKGKYWDDWFCSGCSNKADLDWKENPILSSFCPHCGAEMDFCEAKEEKNDRLEESFQKATVSREQFNRAANEIGDSDEWTGCDKMALAVFVNKLEEKLFGGSEEIDTNKLLNKQKEKMKGAIKISYPDYETGHEKADDILCETLTLLGFGELVTLFKDVNRMYSF